MLYMENDEWPDGKDNLKQIQSYPPNLLGLGWYDLLHLFHESLAAQHHGVGAGVVDVVDVLVLRLAAVNARSTQLVEMRPEPADSVLHDISDQL